EVVVGDIGLLEPGETIPCDGVYLGGQHGRYDEAGESVAMCKASYEERMELIERELIAKLGSLAGGILFTALMIWFFVQLRKDDPVRTSNKKKASRVDLRIFVVFVANDAFQVTRIGGREWGVSLALDIASILWAI
ncbi:hypothetical protein H0H93_007177, partial [Arthromyces matolae]